MANRTSLSLAICGALFTAVALAAPAQAAGLKIGVAPSPNGFVMQGVPTQIAVAGALKSTIYLWNPSTGKYFRMGTATPKAALAYTFTAPGVQRLKVVPNRGKAKTFQVAVYGTFSKPGGNPTPYGSLILPSQGYGGEYSVRAEAGCVLVDVGGRNFPGTFSSTPATWTLTVLSAGANPVALTVPAESRAGVGQAGIPVRGDAVLQATNGGGGQDVGAVWTCTSQP